MKKTIMAVVAYDGTNYQGFQRQKDYGVGVQQVLEKALSTALHEDISIKAAGRTDAGSMPWARSFPLKRRHPFLRRIIGVPCSISCRLISPFVKPL